MLLLPFLAELVQRLAEIFLYSLVASELGLHLVNMLVQLARNHLLVDSEGIDPRLHKEEFDKGGVLDVDTDNASSLLNHKPGYLDKDNELIVLLRPKVRCPLLGCVTVVRVLLWREEPPKVRWGAPL